MFVDLRGISLVVRRLADSSHENLRVFVNFPQQVGGVTPPTTPGSIPLWLFKVLILVRKIFFNIVLWT